MKTIYARLGDLQLGETLEDGTTLGSIGEALDAVGVNIQTSTGDLRDMGDVIEELMGKWQDLDTAQKQALAVKLAGKYQYNNLMALLENSKMYEENLEAAQTSLGTINQQQDIYLDSLEGKLNTLQSTFEGFINSIFNVDDIKPFIDDITGLIKLLTGFTTSIGTTSIFSGILGVGAKVFSNNIGDQVMKASENRKARKKRQESIEEGNKLLSEIDVDSSQLGKDSKTFKAAKSLGSRTSIMNEGQRGQSRQVLSQMAKIENDILDKREKSATILNKMEIAYKNVTGQSLELKMNEEGQVENLDQALLVLNSIKGAFKDIDKSSEKASDSAGKMLASLNSHAEGATRNKNNGFNAKTRDNMFSASTELDDFVKGLATNKKLMNSNGENILSSLPQYQAMMEANTAFGEAVSKMPTKGKKVSQTVSDEVEGAFNKSRQAVVEFIGALQRLDGVDEDTAKSIQELLEKLGIAKSTLGGLSKDVENFSDSLDMKQLASDTAEFVGSLAQAYSAFQSIKSLGKIVNDSDMESGEKISSFIENLLFSAPMLITSMVSLNTSFTNVRTSLKNWNNGLLQSAGIAAATATATDRLKVAVKGVMTLLKSNGLTLLLSIIPTAISFAMGAMEQQAENAKQESQEVLDKYDELKDKAEQTQQAQQKVKENYDIYKQTGKVTDELKDSIEEYAKTLDVPLSKQNLWNENIETTIENLNKAAQLQKEGLRDSSREAANTYEANFRTDQIQKSNKLTDRSYSVAPTEDYFNQNPEFFSKVSPYLETLGFDTSDWTSVQQGMNTLYRVVTGAADFTDLASGIDATEEDIKNIFEEVAKDTSGLFSQIQNYNDVYGSAYLDEGDLSINSPAMLQKTIEEKVIGRKGSLSALDFGLNANKELEVTVKDGATLAQAASQLKEFSELDLNDILIAAGVNGATEGKPASARWRYGEALRSAQTLYQDPNLQGYLSSSLDAAKNELAGILYQKQSNGEVITIDTLLDLLQNSDTITRLHEEGFSADDVGGIAVDLADLFNITLDEDARKQIEGLERTLSATSKNAADVAAEQERAAAKQRAAQYVGENQFGLKGTNYIDKILIPTATKLLGISEDNLYSMIESNRGKLTPDANYDNILNYYKDKNRSGADMDLVAQVLASEEGLINAINGNTDALDSQYDVLVYQKNLKQGAEERYRASQAFTGKSDKAIDAELEAANQTINEKLNSTDYNLTDSQKTSLIADVYSHLDEVIAGTYDWDAAIKRVVTNLDDLSDATKTTQEAFDKASPQIMAAAEDKLKEEKGEDGYTDEDVKNRAEEYGQNLIDSLGDEGAQAVFAGISSGLFDVEGIQNWVTSALKADASKEMIVEWLKEAVQNGVHVDVNAEYDGELDSQIFEKDRKEREAQEKASQWQDFYDSRSKEYSKEYGENSVDMAMKDVNEFEAWLDEHGMTKADFDAMGINTVGKTLEEIEQEVLDIRTGQADKDKREEAEKRKETAPLRMAQNDYMEAKYGKGHVNKDELDESVDSVYDVLKKYNYSVDDLTRLGIDLNQDSSDIISDFLKAIDKTGDSAEEATKSFNELSGSLDEFTGLSDALDSRDSIQGLMKQADDIYTDEGRTYFTQDEAYDILKENPEYIKYLDEVEGGWQLNNRAVLEYEQAVLDAGKAMEELTGDAIDLSQQNQDIVTVMSMDSAYTSADGSGYLDQILTLNHALEDGSIQTTQFLDQISSQFENFFSSVSAQAINAGQSIKEFFDSNDDAANMAQIFSDEMYQGIKQLNTQYQAGKITVGQYARSLATTATNSIKLKAAQHGLKKVEGEWVKVTDHGTVALKDMDKESKSAVKELDTMEKSFDRLSAAADFSDYITDNFDEMTQVFSETGDVLESAKNELGGLSESFGPMIHGLAQEMVDFYKTDELALTATASQIAAATDMTQQQAEEMLTSVDSLASGMMSSSAIAGAAMQGTMTQTQSAINNIATGISMIIQGIMSEVASIDAEVESQVVDEGETTKEVYQTNKKDGTSEEVGTIHIPGFRLRLSGKGSSNGAAGKGGGTSQDRVKNHGTYSFDSVMSTEDARKAGIGIAADAGDGPAVAVYKDDKGHYVALKATDYQTGAWYLGQGTSQLFGDAGLSDYSPSRGGTGYTPTDNSKGGGGGGGGGNGSGSGGDLDTKELLDDEYDRYKKINSQLDKMSNLLEQINSEKERLVGYNKFDYTKQATQNLKRQIELQKQKLELEKQERQEKQAELAKYGIKFDTEGYIDNYEDRFKFYLAEINSLIVQYNNASSEEEQEAINERIEDKQEEFDEYKDLVDKYNDLNSNTIEQTKKEIQDLQDQIEDMITDLFNKAVEAVDTIKEVDDAVVDLKKTFRDFNTEEDDPFLSAEISDNKIASYFDAGTKSAKTFFDTAIARLKKLKDEAKTDDEKAKYQAAIDGLVAGQKLQGQGVLDENGTGYLDMSLKSGQLILQSIKQYNETGKSDLFGENQQAMMEAAKTVFDQLTDMASSLREEIDNLRDSIIDAIDLVADEIEKREDLLDSIGNRLDHLMSMSQILHGDTIQGYKEQNEILAVQSQLADQRLAEATQELDYWNQIASTVTKGSKEEEEALNHVREATEKKNEATENSVNLYKQQVQASANLALAQWQKQWLGTDDMDWAQTQWEMMNRNADYYLDDVNKAYNIQKLQSQYTDLLDGANTLDIQTKITDQMNQQLEYLRTKTNLSEYDVSYAQAQLEILKQQIALEEAQANKSQMKLRRDSQGNYNYVYTANEDNVKSAQDGLLDAQNNAYNLSKEQMKQTQEDSFSAFQQAKQLLLDIWSDTTLGVTEQKKRMQAVIDNLVQYLNMTGEQLSTSQANLLESFYGMVDSLNSENVGSLQEIYDKLKEGSTDAFDSIDTRWSTTITTLLQNKDKFADSMADLQTKMEDSLKQYNTSIENASKIANEKIGDISGSFDGVKSSVEDLTKSFGLLTNKLIGYIDKIGGYAEKLREYQNTFDTISQENGELRQTITDLQDEINKMKLQEAQGKNEGGIISTTPSGSSGKGNGKGDNNGDGKGNTNNFGGSGYSRDELMKGIALAIHNYGLNSGWGNDPDRSAKLIKAYGQDFANDVQDYIDYWYEHDDNKHLYVDSSSIKFTSTNLVGYDTGGYTGDWSDGSGKLALLHSKEIVLNANDTQNILKAVESVRAMTAAMKGATLAEAVGSISSIGKSIETANSRVDQNVNITAEFPNATSADEIREAILGLNNQVLHYTHRKA